MDKLSTLERNEPSSTNGRDLLLTTCEANGGSPA